MELVKIAAQLFMSKLGDQSENMQESAVISALTGLMPTNADGDLDLGGLLGKLNSSGLTTMVASWLGDDNNSPISASQILSLFGDSKVQSFACSLNLDGDTAASGLAEMLPELLDNNSNGGVLSGDAGGMLGSLAKGALGSLFK